MNASVTRWFEQRWYRGQRPEFPLRWVAALFGFIVRRRRRAFLAAGRSLPRSTLPLIVVGNITVGGAGKTPMVIALVEALRARGWHPGVISRGYGGKVREATRVSAQSLPAELGDEPCLIAHRTGAPVAVARRRIDAAQLLEGEGTVDVLIADDGLQHYALGRDIEILVIDGQRRFGNGLLLPAGPLREPVARSIECDFRVVNSGETQGDEIAMHLDPDEAVALEGGARRALSEFGGMRVHAVAGIGNPDRFFWTLHAFGIDVIPHPFPDHHVYSDHDLVFEPELPILMTQKDAVKCTDVPAPQAWYVPVRARLPDTFFDAVVAELDALGREAD